MQQWRTYMSSLRLLVLYSLACLLASVRTYIRDYVCIVLLVRVHTYVRTYVRVHAHDGQV